MTDLFIINEKEMMNIGDIKLREKLLKEYRDLEWQDFDKVNNISNQLKQYIFKVQVKCHGNSNAPIREEEYWFDKDKKVNYNNRLGIFFRNQGRQYDFNCKFLTLPIEEAKRLIDENKGGEDYAH